MHNIVDFLFWIKCISHIRPYSLSYRIASYAADFISPRHLEDDTVNSHFQQCDFNTPESSHALKRYHRYAAINYLNTFLYPEMDSQWLERYISFDGLHHLQRPSDQGILVLTAHQHCLMMLGVALGLSGNCTYPVLMDPDETVPDELKPYFAKAIAESQRHYNGGEYMLVRFGPSYTRNIYRVFEQGSLLISANDFPKNIAPKRRLDIPFYRKSISCPTGTIEIALKSGAKIVTAFISGGINEPFNIKIRPVSDDDPSLKSIMNQYGIHLNDALQADAGSWEGWKWHNLFG